MSENSEDIECPWCGEGGFDLVGLKSHLVGGFFYEPCIEFLHCDTASELKRKGGKDESDIE